jgi:hypothetical protein
LTDPILSGIAGLDAALLIEESGVPAGTGLADAAKLSAHLKGALLRIPLIRYIKPDRALL